MSEALEGSLSRAEERQRIYDWPGAIECYQVAMEMPAWATVLEKARIGEKIGIAFFRSAMQAQSSRVFRRRCAEAIECLKAAMESYRNLVSPSTTGRIYRCEATMAFLSAWLASEHSDRRSLVEACWKLTKKALKEFLQAGEGDEYGWTYNLLCTSAGFAFALQTDQREREIIVREAIEFGEEAIPLLSESAAVWELAMVYARTALFLACLGQYFLDVDERTRCTEKSLRYWSKATTICEEAAFIGLLNTVSEVPFQSWGIGTAASLDKLRKGLEYAKKSKDRLATGCALDWLAFHLFWKSTTCENTDEMLKLLREALASAHNAKKQYAPISFTSPRGFSFQIETADAVCRRELSHLEIDIRKKRRFLTDAEEAARAGLSCLETAGYTTTIFLARHELSRVLVSLARIESESNYKRKLLEEALGQWALVIEGFKRFLPFHHFDQGFFIGFSANTKCEIADLTEQKEVKKGILEEAIAEKEISVKLGAKYVSFYEKVGSLPLIADLGRWQFEYASLLSRLYSLDEDPNHLKKEVEVLHEAAGTFLKLGLLSRAAECFWKTAQTHELLGEELKAAEDFDVASGHFGKASERVPQLADFYRDKSLYMKAWGEIDRAKYHHRKQDYGRAAVCFENAAYTHMALGRWRYLASNYFALGKIDRAEELSKKERCGEAIRLFEQAALLFMKSRKAIQKELVQIEDEEEKRMAKDLLKAADLRRRYCLARVTLENAGILGKHGEYHASAQEYGSAVDIFESISEELHSEDDVRELRFVTVLSKAWQKLMLAEDSDMESLYGDSAQLFEKASEQSNSDAGRLLALGHSRFCRSLEATSRFLDTQDLTTYSTAIQSLQSAKRYYKMADSRNNVEQAKATEFLVQAYAYMNNAQREVDPEKKTRLYRMTEAILRASSEHFAKVKQLEKTKQVSNLLKTVREEQEWALSCAQILRTPPLVSSSHFAPPPSPTFERAIGLNGFEHATVQGYLSAPKEAVVGGELEVRLDLINVSKNSGLLVRIENAIPQSLKIISSEPIANIENGSLDLKGKRLEPLKVDSIKIHTQAIEPGTTTLNPKVIYVDDAGRFKTCKPKQVHVTVKPRSSFEFKAKSAEAILSFLASSYLEDNERKLPTDQCGWRSLVDVMKTGKIPRSSVYRVGGGRGSAIGELEKRGLVEAKVVSGERGRGGNILRLRIHAETEDAKTYVDQHRLTRKNWRAP